MAKILKNIETLGVSPYFISVVTTLCRLYHYPVEKPVYIAQYFYALTPVKDNFYELQKYLNSYFGTTSKTFVGIVQDVISMPQEEILRLNYLFEEAGITGENQAVNPDTPALIISSKTAAPAYVRLLGKITPDLAAQNPREILPVVFDRLVNDENLDLNREKLAAIFAPLATQICENDGDADSLHRLASAVLTQNEVDPKVAKDLTDKLLIYHLAYPDKTDAELNSYLQSVLPKDNQHLNSILTEEVNLHEESRVSNPEPDNESAKEYIQKLESKTPKTPSTPIGKFTQSLEESPTFKKVDSIASLLPFYSGFRDNVKAQGHLQEAIHNSDLSISEKAKEFGTFIALDTWSRVQMALDVVTLGEDKIVLDLVETSGKGLLSKIGPDLVKYSSKISKDSPKAASSLESIGKWTEKTMAENPQLHEHLGNLLDQHFFNPLKSEVGKSQSRTNLFKKSTSSSQKDDDLIDQFASFFQNHPGEEPTQFIQTQLLTKKSPSSLITISPKSNRPVLTDHGRAMADRFALSNLKGDNFDLNKALSELAAKKSQVESELKTELARKPLDKTKIDELYEQKRYLNLAASSLRLRQYHLNQKLRPGDQKVTPLENELVAQFTAHGLDPKQARSAAREFINSGMAIATSHLSGFIDSSDKKSPEAKAGLFSDALSFLHTKFPKLQNFKLDVGKYDKAFNSIAYFRNILTNPQAIISTFSQKLVQDFTKQLGEKYLSKTAIKTATKELVAKGIVKFAGTEIGKQVLKRVGIEAAKLTVEAVAASTGVGILVDIAIEIAMRLYEKVKDFVSWGKRKIKENAPMVAAAVVALFVGLFTSLGVGGAAAAGGITYFATSAIGGVGKVLTGNPSPGMVQGARTAGQVMTVLVTETASESVGGIAIAVLATPVVIALFLFIINSGAYVVPKMGSSTLSGAIPMCWPSHGIITQDPCAMNCSGCTHTPTVFWQNAFDIAPAIPGAFGDPVYATHDGSVLSVIDNSSDTIGYGNTVILASTDGTIYTLYAHLLDYTVSAGQSVTAGEQIGSMDCTGTGCGNTSGSNSHLHYELRTNDPSSSAGSCDLVDFVPEGWHVQGSTDYEGTCYANESGGNTGP